MDNLDIGGFGAPDLNEPIPLDEPIPFDDIGPGESGVSHAPLDLGGPTQAPKPAAPKPAAPRPPAARPKMSVETSKGSTVKSNSGDRIVGVKTFFTKLHAGAMAFLDEQICRWLKSNPDVIVKRTNVVTGDVQGKKTEPNIIITIWY